MGYRINSDRIGIVGEEYTPPEGVNVDALIEHGFIVETKTAAPRGGKVASKKETE